MSKSTYIGRQIRLPNRRVAVIKTESGWGLQWRRLGKEGEPKVVTTNVHISPEAFEATLTLMLEMRQRRPLALTIEIPEYTAVVTADGTMQWSET